MDKDIEQLIVEKTPITINEKPITDSTWGWKLATSIDDTCSFLNGISPYQSTVSTEDICAMWKGNHPECYVFYKHSNQPSPTGSWGWKLATDPGYILYFLSGSGSYRHPVKEAQIAAFNRHSTDPSELIFYSKFSVLRHQDFSEPLSITGGMSIYEHIKSFVHTLSLQLDCNFNTGGGGQVSLSRSVNVRDGRSSGTANDPDACKKPFSNPTLFAYVNPLYLLIHEERHNEPHDPGHVYVGNNKMDPYFENSSGNAWTVMYTMWVYKYGKYPPAIKQEAKQIATSLLNSRFPQSKAIRIQKCRQLLMSFCNLDFKLIY